jgi:tetratricopeptide (TPR) repeat protein
LDNLQLHSWATQDPRRCGDRLTAAGAGQPGTKRNRVFATVPERFTGWDTGSVVFVADDLAAWLTGLLADAGRKKLTTLVLGTDQQRALRSAATVAVQRTAGELRPDDAEQAGNVALVVSQVFGEPAPGAPLAGDETMLEGLQARIAGQLAALDDASLTGTAQSSADVLGVGVTELAEKLTANLLREIMASGSGGGPLAPLASQLNHDRTHLQGQHLTGMVSEVLDALARLDDTRAAPAPTALEQLPPEVTGFTARADEMARLAGLLDPASTAEPGVVSAVAGLAGVGKTTLAVQAGHAARRRGWFGGGVLFVDLHSYDEAPVEPGQALDALLRALGVPAEHIPPGAEERAATYRSKLAQIAHPVLLIADNASTEAQVKPLLPGTGRHKVLVTSRNTLAGLGARLVDVTVLAEEDAIALLDGALRVARPDDERITADRQAALRLARACDGLPLALQITAALLKTDPTLRAAELADELAIESERLEWLRYDDGSGAGAPSVAAAFELSYRRLDAMSAAVFRLLPVNPSPDASTAAIAVLVELPIGETRKVLARLARAHLVEAAPGAAGRWRMHDLVRLYAQRLCDAEDRREQARDRLFGHYLAFARDHQAEKDLTALEAEIAGFMGAVAWANDHQRHHDVLELARALSQFLFVRGHVDEARLVRLRAVQAASALDSTNDALWAAHQLAMLDGRTGRPVEARAGFGDALKLARELGDLSAERSARREMGLLSQKNGQFAEARTEYEQALTLAERLNDPKALFAAVLDLAVVNRLTGRTAEARQGFERELALARELGEPWALGVGLSEYGDFLREHGDQERARILLDEAIQTSERIDYTYRLGKCHQYLAKLEEQQGNTAEALANYRAALRYFERVNAAELKEVPADLLTLETDPEIVQAVRAFASTTSSEEQVQLQREPGLLFTDSADQLLSALADQERQNADPEAERKRSAHLKERLGALRNARESDFSDARTGLNQPSHPPTKLGPQ